MAAHEKHNRKKCVFLKTVTIKETQYDYCFNPEMHKMHNVKNGKKIRCFGNRCGFEIIIKVYGPSA